MFSMTKHVLFPVCCLALAALPAQGAPAAPPPPAEYQVRVRYQIDAYRNEHLAQYFEMLRFFESLGLQKDDGPDNEPEDRSVTQMSGTMPSVSARKLLAERHVRTILLSPKDAKVPDLEAPVRVQLDLTPGPSADRQRVLT